MVFSSGEKCLRKRYKSVRRLKFAFFSRLSHHRYMHAIKYDGYESRQLYISYTSFFLAFVELTAHYVNSILIILNFLSIRNAALIYSVIIYMGNSS